MSDAVLLQPTGEDAATVVGWSDRHPATIVKRAERAVWIQRDHATPCSGAYEEGAVTLYERDYDATIEKFTLRSTGEFVRSGERARGGQHLALGLRDYYRDPHF